MRSLKGREFFRAAKRISGHRTGLCSTELVTHHNYRVFSANVTKPIKNAHVPLTKSNSSAFGREGKGKGKLHPTTGHEDPEGE